MSPTVGISLKAWGAAGSLVGAVAEVTIDGSDSFDFLSLSKKRM